MTSVGARNARGGRREKSGRKAESRQPKAESQQGQSRKPTAESRKVRASKPVPSSLQASKPSGLDEVALSDIVEELRVIENTIATVPGLVEHARAIANAFECDEPQRRDPIARLGLRFPSSGGGRDIDRFGPTDMRMPDDDLLEGMVEAASAVVEAATWRLQRLCRVLFRVSEKAAPGSRNADSRSTLTPALSLPRN